MFTIDLSDFHRKAKAINGAARQIPFLLAVSLTKTMQDIVEAEKTEMRRVFDRPRSFTLNSLRVVPASKGRLEAQVLPKEFGRLPAWRYLGPNIEGGSRSPKSFEKAMQRAGLLRSGQFAVPAPGVALDAYGNVSGALISRILAAIQASPDAMQNIKWKGRKSRAAKKGQSRYFVIRDVGVFQRLGPGKTQPVFIFTSRVGYSRRFPYYEVARKTFGPAMRKQLDAAWLRYVVNPVKAA